MIVFNFLKIDKALASNWYQNLNDKLIRECVRFKINMPKILVAAKRLYFKKLKKHIDIIRKHKEEMEGVHDYSSEFMHQNIKANS